MLVFEYLDGDSFPFLVQREQNVKSEGMIIIFVRTSIRVLIECIREKLWALRIATKALVGTGFCTYFYEIEKEIGRPFFTNWTNWTKSE